MPNYLRTEQNKAEWDAQYWAEFRRLMDNPILILNRCADCGLERPLDRDGVCSECLAERNRGKEEWLREQEGK